MTHQRSKVTGPLPATDPRNEEWPPDRLSCGLVPLSSSARGLALREPGASLARAGASPNDRVTTVLPAPLNLDLRNALSSTEQGTLAGFIPDAMPDGAAGWLA
ncbi:MAG TPA: hypothetical protein VLS44_11715 [Nitrospira sp.]|nr:hypothetical protein [Nitrospira sp.]